MDRAKSISGGLGHLFGPSHLVMLDRNDEAMNTEALFSFRQMNNDSFNTCLVFLSPPVEMNTVDKGATCTCNDPEKEQWDGVRKKIEKTNGHRAAG
jgi:hypothetical protein